MKIIKYEYQQHTTTPLWTFENGWAPIRTELDTSDFSMWINPVELIILSNIRGQIKEDHFENIGNVRGRLDSMNPLEHHRHCYAVIDYGENLEFKQLCIDLELDKFFKF